MAGTLDYVQKGEAITAEKWNALVERINALEQRPNFGFGVSRRPKGGGDKIAAFWLPSSANWSIDANGVYYTDYARFLDLSTGDQIIPGDHSYVSVYAGAGLGELNEQGGSRRWCAFKNNRWELINAVPFEFDAYVSNGYLYLDLTTTG